MIADDRMPVIKAGLEDLRNQLSPGGWKVVENFLNGMTVGVGRTQAR